MGKQAFMKKKQPVAQPGFSFGWGTTRLSFAFFLPYPFPSLPSHPLFPPFMYPLALPLPCRFPLPSLPPLNSARESWAAL